MRVLQPQDYETTPWKNGGGETTEIAISPQGAGLDDFDWRVSMAKVASDGPFSPFPVVDRILVVLDGEGIVLSVGEAPPVTLKRSSRPFAFAADTPTQGRLLAGPIVDLNVMVRRGEISSRVTRIPLNAPHFLNFRNCEAILFCVEGAVRVETQDGAHALSAREALRGRVSEAAWRLSAEAGGLAYLIEIFGGGG